MQVRRCAFRRTLGNLRSKLSREACLWPSSYSLSELQEPRPDVGRETGIETGRDVKRSVNAYFFYAGDNSLYERTV